LFNNIDFYVGLDLPPNTVADVYGDGVTLPFRGSIFDFILCTETLEHVPEPKRLITEVTRVLKPWGVLLLTAPQTWGLHLEPHDYYRFTKYGLHYLAEQSGLGVVEITPTCGLWATLAQRLADTVIHTYATGRSQRTISVLRYLLAPLLMMGYSLDRFFGKRGDTLDYVVVARKPSGS